MFQRVRNSIRSARTEGSESRRRSRPTIRPDQQLNLQSFRRENSPDRENGFDEETVQTTITVETAWTATNENRKPTADPLSQPDTQVFVAPSNDPSEDPVEVLERAQSDITKSSIYLQKITVSRKHASAFLSLVRGDNRSWEAIAVDILRQKTRWSDITLEDCQGEYFDTILSFLFSIDNCAFVHLSNTILTPHSAWCLKSLAFSKTLTKLQFDLIDLGFAIPLLCQGLVHNNSIQCFIVSRCGLNDEKLRELFMSLPKHLEELRIFGNMCRSKGLAAITAVVQHSQHLRILDLSYQHVAEDGKDFGILGLMGGISANKILQVLDLDNTGITDFQLQQIIAALCDNETLEEVMLNHNQITATGVAFLSSRMPDMVGLKKISMYNNKFEVPEVHEIVPQQGHQDQPQGKWMGQGPANDLRRVLESKENDKGEGEEEEYEEVTVLEEEIIEEQTIYGEETVVEEEAVEDDESNDSEEEEYEASPGGDESSTPPPSEDFREPDEVLEDQELGRSTKAPKPEDGSTEDETGEEFASGEDEED